MQSNKMCATDGQEVERPEWEDAEEPEVGDADPRPTLPPRPGWREEEALKGKASEAGPSSVRHWPPPPGSARPKAARDWEEDIGPRPISQRYGPRARMSGGTNAGSGLTAGPYEMYMRPSYTWPDEPMPRQPAYQFPATGQPHFPARAMHGRPPGLGDVRRRPADQNAFMLPPYPMGRARGPVMPLKFQQAPRKPRDP